MVFVSGLSMGSSLSNPLQYQLLVDHLTGHLGGGNVCFALVHVILYLLFIHRVFITNKKQEQSMASRIVHVVVAGNSVELQQGLLAGQVRY